MKNIIWIIILLPFLINSQEQEDTKEKLSKEEKKKIDESYLSIEEYKNSLFYPIHQSWLAIQDPSTASILGNGVVPLEERSVPMRDGEGRDQLYLLEAKLNLSYPLINGRKEYGSGMRKLNRFNFDYGVNFRMLYDTSSPVTPPSQKVGLSWIVNIWNNYNQFWFDEWGVSSDDIRYGLNNQKGLHFANLKFQAHHYSNGQSENSKYVDSITGETRNNYVNGDFSTNYFSVEGIYGIYSVRNKNLHQIGVKYRRDVGTDDGLFAYFKEQENSYGRHRLKFTYDHRSSPRPCVPYHIRFEGDYIADKDLSNFNPNLNREGEYRWSALAMFELTPKFHRAVGYFVSAYYGRDYLNIRYDDIVFVVRAGLTLNLENYRINKAKAVRD